MRRLLNGPLHYFPSLFGTALQGWNRFFFQAVDPTSLGLIRVTIGLLVVWNFLVYGLDLQDFLGSDGWASPEAVEFFRSRRAPYSWSFWSALPDLLLWPAWVACLLVSILFTIGYWTRTTAVLCWLLVVSTMRRAPVSLYGFDQILSTFTLYLAVSGASGEALSVDRFIKRWRVTKGAFARRPASSESLGRIIETGQPEPSIAANLGLRLIQVHLCLIYGMAGLAKLQGGAWWSGLAIWGTVAAGEFRLLDLNWLASYPLLLNLATHASLFLEIGYPIFIWLKPIRPLIVALVIALHLGVGLTLGLTEFSLAMIAGNLAFVSPTWIRSLATGLDPERSRVRVLYDGACPRCRASMALATAADPARLVEPIDLTSVDPETIHPTLTRQKCMEAMQLVTTDGKVCEGYDAVTALARSLPLFWGFGWLGALPGIKQAGRNVYKKVAASRPRETPCTDDVCAIHPTPKSKAPGQHVRQT